MAINWFKLAKPLDEYLPNIMTSLNPLNISIINNEKLNFSLEDQEVYSLLASYDNKTSSLENLFFQDINGTIFYMLLIYPYNPFLFPPSIPGYPLAILFLFVIISYLSLIFMLLKKRLK